MKKSGSGSIAGSGHWSYLFLMFAVLFSVSANAGKVKMLLMGDTQKITDQAPDKFLSTMGKLLTDNVTKDANFVLQMGDLTEDDKISCWTVVQQGWRKLEDKMFFVLNVGNNDGNGDNFIKYFPLSRYNASSPFAMYRASFVSNYNDHRNVAHKISAGGIDWLIISIMRFPGSAEVSWAEGLIKANPGKKIIIVNHTQGLGDGDIVWNMIKKYPNVAFTFLGHNVVMHEMLKANDGHNVGRIQTCWHTPEKDHYFCLVELNTDDGTGAFSYYSPLNANYTGDKWTWNGLPKVQAVEVALDNNKGPLAGSGISAYPNPFTRSMRITLSGANHSADEITVTNLRGEVVRQWKIPASGKTSSVVWDDLDRSRTEVAPGSYIVQVRSAGKTLGSKILLKSNAQ